MTQRPPTQAAPSAPAPASGPPGPPPGGAAGGGLRLRPAVVMGLLALSLAASGPAQGQETAAVPLDGPGVGAAIVQVAVPAYGAFADAAADLERAVGQHCDAASPKSAEALTQSLIAAQEAWAHVQPFTFGPIEEDNHRPRVQFWPDTRNVMGRQVEGLLRHPKPDLMTPENFPKTSVAVQGLPALSDMLSEGDFTAEGDRGAAACALGRAIGHNLTTIGRDMAAAWGGSDGWEAKVTTSAAGTGPLGGVNEVAALLVASISQGLSLVKDLKLEQPLGESADMARPGRVEAPRTGVSLALALATMETTAALYKDGLMPSVAKADAPIAKAMADDLDEVLRRLGRLDGPLSEMVSDPGRRFRVEDIEARLAGLQAMLATRVAPAVGLIVGFNSLDGD